MKITNMNSIDKYIMQKSDNEEFSNLLGGYPICLDKICSECKKEAQAKGLKWTKGGKEYYKSCQVKKQIEQGKGAGGRNVEQAKKEYSKAKSEIDACRNAWEKAKSSLDKSLEEGGGIKDRKKDTFNRVFNDAKNSYMLSEKYFKLVEDNYNKINTAQSVSQAKELEKQVTKWRRDLAGNTNKVERKAERLFAIANDQSFFRRVIIKGFAKINPIFPIMRNAFLLVVKINAFNIATRLGVVKAKADEGNTEAQEQWRKVINKWQFTFGGSYSNLLREVDRGKVVKPKLTFMAKGKRISYSFFDGDSHSWSNLAGADDAAETTEVVASTPIIVTIGGILGSVTALATTAKEIMDSAGIGKEDQDKILDPNNTDDVGAGMGGADELILGMSKPLFWSLLSGFLLLGTFATIMIFKNRNKN